VLISTKAVARIGQLPKLLIWSTLNFDMSSEKLKNLHDKRLLAFKRGEWGAVLEACQAILDFKEKDPLALHDMCVACWRRGDREEARNWARKTAEAFINDQAGTPVENQMKHMITLMKAGRASPRYLRHYEVLGEILYEEGAFEAARDFFEQLTYLKGHFSRKYIYIFKCNLHLREFEEAKKQYLRMAREFPGREGHLLVSFREYLGRHLNDNEACDLYIELLYEAGVQQKEIERLKNRIASDEEDREAQALLRAHYRIADDVTGEFYQVKQDLKSHPNSVQLLVDYARLGLEKDIRGGMKALVRSLQLAPDTLPQARDLIKVYMVQAEREIQEDLCKGLLAFLDDDTSRALMLDLSAELPENELLYDLKKQWAGTTDSFAAVGGNMTMMLENLSLTDLVKAKMRMEEHIDKMKQEMTYLVLDIAGSTRLKEGVSPERVMVSFAGFHKVVDRAVKAQGGQPFHDEGDGKIMRFSRAIDAVRAAREISEKLDDFNEKGNKIGVPITVRMGLHTGMSLIDDKIDHHRVADRVLDVACHLEKYGVPGEIHLSQESVEAAGLDKAQVEELGWREKSGVTAYKLKN
jgi:class 3 adenylate cyclase